MRIRSSRVKGCSSSWEWRSTRRPSSRPSGVRRRHQSTQWFGPLSSCFTVTENVQTSVDSWLASTNRTCALPAHAMGPHSRRARASAAEDILQSQNIVYQLKLPPPEGPAVVSPTHPNQSAWYSDNNAVLRFTNETSGVESFSYVLNKDPITVPDNIGEGNRQLVSYSNLSDGIHYFHIKALRDGIWSGVTHFAVKIDTSMPADFPIEILPSKRTI